MDIETLKSEIREDWNFHGKWRDEAREAWDFYHGDQWSETDKYELEEQAKMALVFNRVAPIINAVAGTEINNRTEVRFIPRTMGDAKVNETLTAGAEWFRDAASAEEEESQAFMSTLVCGLGVTETTLDFETDPEGEPVVTRLDELSMCWDRHARRKGLKDARRVCRVMEMPVIEAMERFPGNERQDLDASWLDVKETEEGSPHINLIGDQYKGEGATSKGEADTVRVVQAQWSERQKFVEFVEPMTGERKTISEADFDKLLAVMPEMAMLTFRRFARHVWHQAFIGADILGEKTQPCEDSCTFKFITGHFDRKSRRWYGMMRVMMDPQKFANKFMSQTLHIINSNSKGGVLIESDATDDIQDLEDSWASADAVHVLKPGGLGKIQEKGRPDLPVALMTLMEYAVSSIRDVTGVNLEILGMREANQPGVLEYQRRQSAMTTLAGMFDALRTYRKDQGGVILYFLRKYIAPTGRLVRITEDGESRYEPLEIGDDAVKYDVIVDDAPSAPNQKERTWTFIEGLMPALQSLGLPPELWVDIMEHSPLPTSLTEKIRGYMEQAGKQPPDPMEQQLAELAIAKERSEIAENMSNAEYDRIRAQREAQEASLAYPRFQMDAEQAALAALNTPQRGFA